MKYRNKVFFLLVFILLFLSCKKKEIHYIVENIEMNDVGSYNKTLLSARHLDLFDSCLMEPQRLWCMDSFLMIFDEGCKYEGDDFLRFYDRRTNKLWRSYGKIGRGPGEHISPHFFKQSEHEVLITEKMKYSVLNLDSLAGNKNYCPLKRNVKGGLTAVSYACKVNDSVIFFNSSSPWQYSFINVYTDERENFNNFPAVVSHPKLTDFVANTNVYSANYSVRTGDYSYLCVAYYYFPVVDIVSLKNRHLLRLIFPFDKHSYEVRVLDPLNAVLEGRHNFYRDIYTTENSIYLLYRNYSNKFEFHQFTWDGKLKQRYVVDEYIKTFCVDEISGEIYAVKRGDNYEPELIVYNF